MSGWLDPIPTTVLYDLGGKAAIFISLGISLALFSYVGITGGVISLGSQSSLRDLPCSRTVSGSR